MICSSKTADPGKSKNLAGWYAARCQGKKMGQEKGEAAGSIIACNLEDGKFSIICQTNPQIYPDYTLDSTF